MRYVRIRLAFALGLLLTVLALLGAADVILLTDNAAQTAAIQASRVETCREGNAKHDRTVRVLHLIVKREEKRETRAERKLTQNGLRTTMLIVNALAPRRNCVKFLATSS